MEVKDILKKKRESLRMTCEEVGAQVGVAASTISRWENGDIANMKRDKIINLAKVLNNSPAVIMNLDDIETINIPPYYFDANIQELIEFIHNHPKYKVLFDATMKIKEEDIPFIKEFMDRMRPAEPDDTGC